MYRAALHPLGKNLCTSKLAQQASGSGQIVRASFSSALHSRRSSPSSRNIRSKAAKTAQKKTIDDLVVPVRLGNDAVDVAKSSNDGLLSTESSSTSSTAVHVGNELTGGASLTKGQITTLLNRFMNRAEIRQLCEQRGLGPRLFNVAFLSFRTRCLEPSNLSPELYVTLHDALHERGHVDDLLPHFMDHAKKVYPHLECLDDLKKVSDLRLPHNWYSEARALQRKIVFHAGPTNSGKTYQALKSFMAAKSGVYCGPLKMLANEVFHKTNDAGVPCDLVTGEERRYASAERQTDDDGDDDDSPPTSPHLACTVEMLNTAAPFDVAVIDEIQMLRDTQRGWAWTRALLGVNAKEVHLCGETAAVSLVQDLLFPVNEEVTVFKYKRMTPLRICTEALGSFNSVRNGDCIVAFGKSEIYNISREMEKLGRDVAVIYGSLPPATKLAQAQRFNDPESPCKVLVATDAIGMGLNLSIKRVIFTSLLKPQTLSTGERKVDQLSTSAALQIAGRAGRFGTAHEFGEVTTLKRNDLPTLRQILSSKVEKIEKAGLYPTAEQVEMFSFFLPDATLSNLMDIFVSLCSVDESRYFMCNIEEFKCLAAMIEHIPRLSLRTRYVFCLAPVNTKQTLLCQQFVKFARKFATGEPLTWPWLADALQWSKAAQRPKRIVDLARLEVLFDVFDVYLWLGCRFVDAFRDQEIVRQKQREIDRLIEYGVDQIAALLTGGDAAETQIKLDLSEITGDDDDDDVDSRSSAAAATATPSLNQGILKGMAIDTSQKASRRSRTDDASLFRTSLASDRALMSLLKDQLASLKQKALTANDKCDGESSNESPDASAADGNDAADAFASSSLTRRLIRRGLLTPSMVLKLRREWALELSHFNDCHATKRAGRKKGR